MDRAQFEQAAVEHLDACYRMALQLTKRPDDAADLVQEAYLRALTNFTSSPNPSFTEKGRGLRAWLFTIIHNTFYSRAQRSAKGPTLASDLDSLKGVPPSDDAGPNEPPPAWDLRTLDWDHTDERLKKAIESLSAEHREVLLLWGVEGMKYREISAVTGVPIGTVMSRLHRARVILAESLEELRADLGWKKEAIR
jgi:RNA polymerase sigma-70 factor (ECF subfamily)